MKIYALFEVGREEPSPPNPDVYILVPTIKNFATAVRGMQGIDKELTVYASMGGELTLKVCFIF